jgi:HlyD family secretion protein
MPDATPASKGAMNMSDQLTNDLASLKIDRDAPRPGSGALKVVLWLAVAGAVIGVAAFVGYPMLASRVFKTKVELTEIALVSPAQSSVNLTATGYVAAKRRAKVAPKVFGRIAEMKVEEGQVVKAGDLLATMEDADVRASVQSARARVQSARARVQSARAALAETDVVLKRESRLVEQGVTPQATIEDLRARANSQREQVKAAEAEVKAVEAEVAAYETNLGNYAVLAPIDGTITYRANESGEVVNPELGYILEMADFSTLVVEIDVSEGKLANITMGGPAEIILDAFPGKRYRGQTVEIGRRVNRSKATVMVKVKFVDAAEGALPDMAARVNFLAKELDAGSMKEPPKVVVPSNAVVDRDGAKVVYVYDAGKIRMQNIELGEPFGDGFVVKSGPTPGTKLVREPSADLRDGMSVKEAGKD